MSANILAAVDLGSDTATVIARAASLAELHGGKVTVLHCHAETSRATDAYAAIAAAVEPSSWPWIDAVLVERDQPGIAEVIETEAVRLDVAMIVVGRSARPVLSQLFRGSTTVDLVRRTCCPVLAARTRVTGVYRSALVAVDADTPADAVARQVRQALGPIRIELFTVVNDAARIEAAGRALREAADRVAEPDWSPVTDVVAGDPEAAIRRRVAAVAADVLVLQPEQKGWLVRTLVGSLTEAVIATADDCDVLAIPQP